MLDDLGPGSSAVTAKSAPSAGHPECLCNVLIGEMMRTVVPGGFVMSVSKGLKMTTAVAAAGGIDCRPAPVK